MLEVRTEPELPDDARARLGQMLAGVEALAGNPFGVLGGAGELADVAAFARSAGADRITLDAFPADPGADLLATMAGFELRRVLLQLRGRLPLPPNEAGEPFTTRPFRPGTADEQAWLDVNNRAFAWHPEQRDQTLDDLHAKMAEPWFDPAGFLLHERDGRLAAFCWTKVHEEESPAAGEIYVIGVDPDFQGQGLGAPMTRAGLDWLADHGLTRSLLYVESDNHAALRVYQRLGFAVATTHRWYDQTFSTA